MSTRPDDIPQDVWDAARSAIEAAIAEPGWNPQVIVSRAILAERERCALLTFAAYERKTELCSKIIRRIRSGEGLVR